TGHVKIVTKAYAETINLKPYDLGFLDFQDDFKKWTADYPNFYWVQRINFGALLDFPDEEGNTIAQGDVVGFGVNLLQDNKEIELLNLKEALVEGALPSQPGELLISQSITERLGLEIDDTITLIGSTVSGSMSFTNFQIAGTLKFGVELMDRGGVIADIEDIRKFLDMENGAAEVLGFSKDGTYKQKNIERMKQTFNLKHSTENEFSPVMVSLTDQNGLGRIIQMMDVSFGIMIVVFIFIMGIVLWNSGLMNCIRRYGEIGIRLAMGEEKHHLYNSLLLEAIVLGIISSLIGTALGALVSWYFNIHGMDVGAYNRESTILSENVIYTSLSLKSCLWGFLPGVVSPFLGVVLAGMVIFKRKTSQLFKELES
ncbi:MAG: FtsX-like permease family protein, partial [Candidatus Cloacimonetes bacterium]|nr:FtsX-like permease family protein [Candidatus Cloacimonadota bacterium]